MRCVGRSRRSSNYIHPLIISLRRCNLFVWLLQALQISQLILFINTVIFCSTFIIPLHLLCGAIILIIIKPTTPNALSYTSHPHPQLALEPLHKHLNGDRNKPIIDYKIQNKRIVALQKIYSYHYSLFTN